MPTPTETETRQAPLLDELAKRDPRIKKALEEAEREMSRGEPPADIEVSPLGDVQEGEGATPEDVEDLHISEWLDQHNASALPVAQVRRIMARIRAAIGRVKIPTRQASTGYILPSVEISALANEAAQHLTLSASIEWIALHDAITKIESEGKVIQLASRLYDDPVNPADPHHRRVYQSVRDSVLFVLQCILENNGYEWSPKRACWEK